MSRTALAPVPAVGDRRPGRGGRLRHLLPTSGALLVLAGVLAGVVAGIGIVTPDRRLAYVAGLAVAWILFGVALLLLRRVPDRAVPAVVVGGTVALLIAALTDQPTTSTDSARYAWDGIVQTSGISPYRFAPADAHLAALRPDWLFPAPIASGPDGVDCPGLRAKPTQEIDGRGAICTAINRPSVPTVYPPVAEALFALVRLVVPRNAAYLPLQILGAVAVLATVALLLVALRHRGLDPRRAAAFGWCPFVLLEAGTNAHIDGTATLLAVGASLLVARGRPTAGGAVLGLAIATKVLPALVAAPLVRRTPIRVAGAAALVVAAVYLPHLLTVGEAVLGYLPGYLEEEGYDDGTRSALLSAVLPPSAATVAAALLLAALAVAVLVRADPSDPWASQVLLIGGALLLASPRYGWYALLLVPFIVLSGRWEWFAAVLLFSAPVIAGEPLPFRLALLAVVGTVVGAGVVRRGRRRHQLVRSL